ncbi:MAG: BNR/Asp-box repeat protein, partial [Solirubrobacterales bacterium]|nr:BNR/Asp-box repeat protein [Solirubrobacterales bacterium]
MPRRATPLALVVLLLTALPAVGRAAVQTPAERARAVRAAAGGPVDPAVFGPLRARFGVAKPADAFTLPAGELRVSGTQLLPGPGTISFRVTLNRPAPGEALVLGLPERFVARAPSGLRYADSPALDHAPAAARLTRTGRAVAVGLDGVRAGAPVATVIRTLALPAGTYLVPVRWRAADGRQTPVGTVRITSFALTREGPVDPDADQARNPFRTLRSPLAGLEADASAPDAGDEESETFDIVVPIDSDRIVTAANDVTHIERGVYLSDDGGKTFAAPRFPSLADAPGVAAPETTSVRGDPILAADRLGNVWAGGLTVCTDAGVHSRIFVARIPAGTQSFAPTLVGLPYLHSEDGCVQGTEGLQDKPMMTIDDAPSSPTYGRLYVSWDDPDPSGAVNEALAFCDTRVGGFPQAERCDNADTWVGPVLISPAPGSYVSSVPATGPDGKVYVAWWDYSANNAISIVSCDAATADCNQHASWSAPRTAAQLDADPVTGEAIPFGCPINAQPGGRAAPVPSLAVDHSGGPGTGRIYLAWSDLRPGSGTTRCRFAAGTGTPPLSTHQTWDSFVASGTSLTDLTSAPTRTSPAVGTSIIGDAAASPVDASNSDDWFPWVAVDQTTGQAWVGVYSTTGDPTRNTVNTYIARVAPTAGTQVGYSDLQKVSARPSDYSGAPCCTFGNDYGDYTGNAAAEGIAVPVYTSRPDATSPGRVLVFVRAAASPQVVLQQAAFGDAYGAAGDGKVQPGEAFVLTTTLRNTGPVGATGLQGALSSTFPGVRLSQAASAFPDLAPGALGANAAAFAGTLAPTTPCGVTIDLLLGVATAQGPEQVPVPVAVSCGPSQARPGAGTTRPLPTAFRFSAAVGRQALRTVRTRGLRLRLKGTAASVVTLRLTVSPATARRLGLPGRTLARGRLRLGAGRRV